MKIIDQRRDQTFGTVYKYEHEDIPVQGWAGKPFIDFTSMCTGDLDIMDDELCQAMAKADLSKYPIVTGVIPPKLSQEYPVKFENTIMYEFDGDRGAFANMTPMERRKYLFFRYGSTIPWFFILDLKPNMFATKHHPINPWSDWAKQHIPYMIEQIESMPFDDIGRVVIYGSWPESTVPCHRDETPSATPPNHINVNPGGYRPVYVYDSIMNTKHYLPKQSKYYAYNVTDYHGVDAVSKFSYTVRVDGVFNQSALTMAYGDES